MGFVNEDRIHKDWLARKDLKMEAPYVEKRWYLDYIVKDQFESRIDGSIQTVDIGFKCPSCSKVHDLLEHGEQVICSCGLIMVRDTDVIVCRIDP